jgi:hypothetical protein
VGAPGRVHGVSGTASVGANSVPLHLGHQTRC